MVSKLKKVLNVGETCLHVYLFTTFRPGANESQKWTLDFLKLELQMIVSYLWVLRIEPRSVGRAVLLTTESPFQRLDDILLKMKMSPSPTQTAAAVTTTATKPSLPAFSTSNLVKDNPKVRCSWRLKEKGYFTHIISNNY